MSRFRGNSDDQLAMLRDDPGLVEPAVENLLRWLSVVQTPPRGRPRRRWRSAGTPSPRDHS
ncbi:hypothetical protein [Amycolatopsis roodepoortensis]|uniref:hypothetical protein n=1 Tax=Amycolatopsis roodepoortensis TaxID=700274 RepID=UPI0027D924DA|nr:hypothetical protein [Amycolatopsis roodepoortensis]